jgi:hypothetical protein
MRLRGDAKQQGMEVELRRVPRRSRTAALGQSVRGLQEPQWVGQRRPRLVELTGGKLTSTPR